MFEIGFLGTSAHLPTRNRNLTTTLITKDAEKYLVDCAEDTQRQILSTAWGLKSAERILLTSEHSNHILGLGGLVSTVFRWEIFDQIQIYGEKKSLDVVKQLLQNVVLRGKQTRVKIEYLQISIGIFIEEKSYSVSVIPIDHAAHHDSSAYLFEEKSHRPFLSDVADKLNIPWGPERRSLVNGESLTLDNGVVISPEQVLGPARKGTKLLYIGDVSDLEDPGLREAAKDADCLIMEATYPSIFKDKAKEEGHLTAAEAAGFALQTGTRHLFLNHIDYRFSGGEILNEAQEIFPGTIVPNDFDRYQIAKDQAPIKISIEQRRKQRGNKPKLLKFTSELD